MGIGNKPLEAEFLRRARRQLGLTQQQIADASMELPCPISREFIAGLETRGLYGTVRKFLTYWQLTRFDLHLLADLTSLDLPEPDRLPSLPELTERVRAMCEAGKLREALALAVAAARRAEARGLESDRARCLVTASIVAAKAQFWSLAREFVEEALASEALSEPNEIRARIQYAGVMGALGRHVLALDILGAIDRGQLRQDPDAAARYWHSLALQLRGRGDFRGALSAARRAVSLYEQLEDGSGDAAIALAILAECLGRRGQHRRASELAQRAIEQAERTTNFLARCRTLYQAGVVALEASDLDAADLFLRRCVRLAERIGYTVMACEANVERLRLEMRRGRKSVAQRLMRKLNTQVRRHQLDRETRQRFERLRAQWQE